MEKKILATVGEKEITNLDVENALKSLDPYQAMHFQTEEGKKQLLEDLVNQELFYMQAKEDQLHNDEDFKAEMKKIEENMLKQYAINKVLSNVTLTEEEKKAFFEANKSKFNKPESASAKHILVDSEELANDILNKINNNEMTFEAAASAHSTCPSKDAGGDLGTFTRGQMVPEFEEAAFGLELEKVSEPVQTQFGYHLIKVDAKNEPKTSEFADVKNQIIQKLIQENQEKKYLDLIKELEAKYDVKRF